MYDAWMHDACIPSSDYQCSSWNCKYFLRNDPIPKWMAMKEEAEPEGSKGLQHIRKTKIFEDIYTLEFHLFKLCEVLFFTVPLKHL